MTQIQIRRDTSTNWSTNNPTPASGEPCYETDTGKFKIGNGTTPYNNLEYIGAGDLPDNITTQGNTFNGANQLVQLDSSGKLPAIDGSALTNISASAPSNMVTTDTDQTITGNKTFDNLIVDATGTGQANVLRATVSTSSTGRVIGNVLTCNTDVVTYANTLNIGSSFDIISIGAANATITDGNDNTFLTTGNFATVAPTGALKYWTGTETEYTAITTKDPDTLYRTTDTSKVYLGDIQLSV